MKRFDCLAQNCQLFGPHLLEASAGTGKTFTIEHVFVRLILEKVPLEQILVVTFTRAATRELKHRIRANLEKAFQGLTHNEPVVPYLESYVGRKDAIFSLSQAKLAFDDAKIFTIHGFCYRMLKEFSFATGTLFPIADPDNEMETARKIRSSLAEFWLSKVDHALLCPEQIALLFGKYDTLQELGFAIASGKKETEERSFDSWKRAFSSTLKEAPRTSIREEFEALFPNYKAHKGDFKEQVTLLTSAFENPEDPIPFRKLIAHQGSIFSFLDPRNRKLKAKTLSSPFFEWAQVKLGPIILEAADRKNILRILTSAWKKWEKEKVGILQPDEIVEEMDAALENPNFLHVIQKKFQAVIIDEFQDTDAIQWNIFQKAFLNCPTLFLVGDPKQSIYRFRNADVYTYFLAKEQLGFENIYKLDTNFRSSKELIFSLNKLFSRNWLNLPQKKSIIEYTPVLAGSEISSALEDDKMALHWMIGQKDASFDETFLPYAVAEIERLQLSEYKSVAILVKDRYEAQSAVNLLKSRKIPVIARSHQLLSQTLDFCYLRELFEAIANPEDESAGLIAKHGPFHTNFSYFYWKHYLEENGLPKFFAEFFKHPSSDLRQIMERLFIWEQNVGFSFSGVLRVLGEFDDVRKRAEENEDAVQILTLHVSKGLEFDIVFALGLASPSVEQDEEMNAEKLRQLYVAMTRAKKRLYVPYKPSTSKRVSPMDLFVSQIESEVGPFVPYLGKLIDVSYENLSTPFILPFKKIAQDLPQIAASPPSVKYSPSYIQSFTRLAQTDPVKIESLDEILPRGKETGTIIHEVFEQIFQKNRWKADTDVLVEKALQFTPLEAATPVVQELVRKTLSQKLSDGIAVFSLKDVDEAFPEMEFLYRKDPHYITGSMDLVFIFNEKVYLVDWKTNVLGNTPASVVMQANDYHLQASLYKEALKRHFGQEKAIGGIFYIFVRTGEYVFIE